MSYLGLAVKSPRRHLGSFTHTLSGRLVVVPPYVSHCCRAPGAPAPPMMSVPSHLVDRETRNPRERRTR